MGIHRGQLPPIRCQPLPASRGRADGLIRLSGRIPAAGDTQSIIMSPGQQLRSAGLGKAGCSWPPAPAATADHPRTERPPARTAEPRSPPEGSPPAARHDSPARRTRRLSRDREQTQPCPGPGNHDRIGHRADRPPRNLTREPSRGPSSGSTGRSQACPIGGKPTGPRPLSNSCTLSAVPRIRAHREERHRTRLRSPANAGKADIACNATIELSPSLREHQEPDARTSVARRPVQAGRRRHGGRHRVMVNIFWRLRADPVLGTHLSDVRDHYEWHATAQYAQASRVWRRIRLPCILPPVS
jgi:hypothetical protein